MTKHFHFEGRVIPFTDGMSVASALVAAGEYVFRTTQVSQSPRGPFCMMGACFECLVEIDGQQNQQACQVIAEVGMNVGQQHQTRIAEEGRER